MTQREILGAAMRAAPMMVARLAVEHVRTIEGAQLIWHAERDGRCRPEILRACDRKIEELGGKQLGRTSPILEVRGEMVETASIGHQQKTQIVVPRIVAATGRATRRHF